MTILVYGGNGFIGQHVARYLVDAGERVVVTTNSRPSAPPLLSDAIVEQRVFVEPMDMTDPFAVMSVVSRHRPRITIDASGHRPKAFAPGRDVSLRIGALVNVLEAARLNKVARVVLLSSMDAYWGLGRDQVPYREDMNVPLLEQGDNFIVQSWVKKSLEVIGNLYRRQQRMDVAFVRASGVYGPLYRTFLNVPSRLVRAAVRGVHEFGEDKGGIPFGEDGYDQVYVKDLARGIGLVALASTLKHPVYNIGSGRAPTYAEFARAVHRAVPDFQMELRSRRQVPDAPDSGMNGIWMDISRARDELGYAPSYSVDDAVAEYVAWMREHPSE
jgi:nucleoside-diphosphate-sugar epimerase